MKSNIDSSVKLIDVYPYRIKNGNPEFLLFKRSESVIYAGQWRMVGGKVQNDETYAEAAIRELKEETGIHPTLFWCLPTINTFFDFNTDTFHQIPVFSAELPVDAQPVLNHEHTSFDWFTAEMAQKRLLWPEQQRIVNIIKNIISEQRICNEWIIKQN
jgi:dATP pyrophosphohydrolase